MTTSILVSGGAGYIGSHVTLALMDAGHRVVVADDLSTGRRELVPAGAAFVHADVGDRDRMAEVFAAHQVGAVIHLAGSIVVPESVSDPLRYYANNAAVSRSLIETSVRCGARAFIFSSTAAVYGDPRGATLDEEAPTRPINPYGRSKLMTEWMLADTRAAHGLPYMALRYFNVAGADAFGRSGQSSPVSTHLIKVACEAALGKRDSFALYGTDYDTPDGTCVRDFVHVSDLAQAHVLALAHLLEGGGSAVLNCGYGRGFSVREVLRAVEQIAGLRIPTVTAARRPGDPARLVAHAEHIRRVLGWTPRHADLEEIVASALAWERYGLPARRERHPAALIGQTTLIGQTAR